MKEAPTVTPMKDLAEELNRRVAIYRSELQTRDSIASAPNGELSRAVEPS